MALQLNTNVSALTVLFNLQNVNAEIGTSIQRLSTGLRINSPADDPAGFVISNSLQTQVDSLNQALANTQSSTNLVKTATGALTQITTLLNSIHASALDAAANASINPSAAQADQVNIQSALQSINSIVTTTQFGTKNLLDGSAGTSAAVTNPADVGGISFGGSFGGGITQTGNVTITVVNAATYAQAYSTAAATYASVNATLATVNGGTTGTGGSIVINGQSITVTGSDTVQTLLNQINNLSATTGVSAAFSSANGSGAIVLTQQNYGANFKISESESAALIVGTAGTGVAGLNATVSVTASTLIGSTVTTATVTFVGGRLSTDSGLHVTDTNGNSILLTTAGNTTATTNATVGALSSHPLQFQIGANFGQTASVTLPNVFPSNLGTTSVPGQSLASIDVTTAAGANNAILISNEALNQVSQYQAQLGGFQTNVLQTTTNVLSTAVQNLSASISSIEDVNIASEVTNLTNLQVIQQAGLFVLHTAESLPALYLQLLG